MKFKCVECFMVFDDREEAEVHGMIMHHATVKINYEK